MDSAGLRSKRTKPQASTKAPQKRAASDDKSRASQKKPRVTRVSRAQAQPQANQETTPDNEVLSTVALAEPSGQIPSYSNFRVALCDSLEWFKSHDSGLTSKNCVATGILLTGRITPRDVIQSQVIVTLIGGGFKSVGKHLIRTEDQPTGSGYYQFLMNAMINGSPVGVLVGKQIADAGKKIYANNLLSVKLEHHYNVLDWFFVTDIWPEYQQIQRDGTRFKQYMMKLQKVNLNSLSWWIPRGHERDVVCDIGQFHCNVFTCNSCKTESKQIFEQGWCCINTSCTEFFHFSTPGVDFDSLQYNDAFLKERTTRDPTVAVRSLIPSLPFIEPGLYGSEMRFKGGIICPTCRHATRRQSWTGWKCENCPFQLLMPPRDVGMPMIHQEERAALKRNKNPALDHRIVKYQQAIRGYEVTTYYLPNSPMNHDEADFIGSITLFRPTKTTRERKEGLDDLFQEMQKETRQGSVQLNRRPARCSGSHIEELTSHFACNMGADYKFGVVVKTSNSFSSAPPPVMKALSRLTWTGRIAAELSAAYASTHGLSVDLVSMPPDFVDFNEQLILGYFEGSKISFHDDGEKELGPTVATLSLGSPSVMHFRGRNKFGFGTEGKGTKMLTLRLQHGDTVIMHGTRIHQYYEHSVDAAGIRRFGVTCRYIRPETMVNEESRERAIVNGEVPLYWQDRAYSGEIA